MSDKKVDKVIETKIKNIIAGILEVSAEEINEDTAIGDLPTWDSLHHLQIIAMIENTFGFRFTPDIIMDLEDVGDIVKATEDRVKQ